MTLRFELDDLSRSEVHRLLEEHLADMHATSPPESIHALDLRELRSAAVEFWSAWEGTELRGCGALKDLGGGDVELKSMRTAPAARGKGVGTEMLRHLLKVAAGRGYRRVWLETGSQDFFAPARRLYARHGFTPCEPFADYVPDPNSVFMTLHLDGDAVPGIQPCPR
jgi:putative acetyltransferase